MTRPSTRVPWSWVALAAAVLPVSCDRSVTTAAESPDGQFVARVVERSARMDRNFDVVLEREDGEELHVYSSPDEGRPPGTERLWWSADSRYLLLTGENFYLHDGERGDLPYLLYDVREGTVATDASQTRDPLRLDHEVLRAIEWVGEPPLRR